MKQETFTNILDYIRWRGDLTFTQAPFNECDALIFARFSYLDLREIVSHSKTAISLKKAYEKYQATFNERRVHWPSDAQLFELMSQSERFSKVKLHYFEEKCCSQTIEQFCAVTISLDEKTHYISFRGTDNSVTGWKEDLMMTFEDHVSSQVDGLNYLKKISSKLAGKLYVGGHSKGGNIAIYAPLFVDENIQKRIVHAYAFDGPGLHKHLFKEAHNPKVVKNISNYIPQSSLFGRMLEHKENIVTVYSNASGAYQHDIYSWNVMQKMIVRCVEDTAFSRIFNQTLHDYLDKLTREERAQIVSIVFEVLDQCEETTMHDFSRNFFKNLPKIMGHLTQLDTESEIVVKEALSVVTDSLRRSVMGEITENIPILSLNKTENE